MIFWFNREFLLKKMAIKHKLFNISANKKLNYCCRIFSYTLPVHSICCIWGTMLHMYIYGSFAVISICHYMYLFSIHVLYSASFKKKTIYFTIHLYTQLCISVSHTKWEGGGGIIIISFFAFPWVSFIDNVYKRHINFWSLYE